MAYNQKSATLDALLRLKDAGLVASSAAATVGGSARVLDLGAGRVDGRVQVRLTAVEVATGDEVYRIITQFSNSATFASGVVNGPALIVGDSSTTAASADNVAGEELELPFANEVNGTVYRYMRVFTQIAGTIATGINYTADAVLSA